MESFLCLFSFVTSGFPLTLVGLFFPKNAIWELLNFSNILFYLKNNFKYKYKAIKYIMCKYLFIIDYLCIFI